MNRRPVPTDTDGPAPRTNARIPYRWLAQRWPLPLHWLGVAGAVFALGATAVVGLRLIGAAGRAPAGIEAALQVRNQVVTALGIVATMESDRRAYQLTRMPEHLGALQHDHARVHDVLAGLREAVAGTRPLAGHVARAEQLIGSWRDEVAVATDRTPLGPLDRDRALLGAARTHLTQIVTAVDNELNVSRQRVAASRSAARRLWVFVTVAALIVIVSLAHVAHRRQLRWRRSAGEMARLLEAVPFAVISLDARGCVRHATGLATQLFGSREPLVGQRLVDKVTSLDGSEVEHALTRAAAGGAATCEAQVQTEFDATRVLAFSFMPLCEQGRQVGVSAVVRDATVERALQVQGRATDRLARIGTMAAAVAHEINGALTAIIGGIALVDNRSLDEASRGTLATAQAEARRAARTARIILDFSRRNAHHHEPLDLTDVLQRAIALRRYDPRSHDVDFRLLVSPDCPRVAGDAQELLQVFLNLLVNAEHAVHGQPLRRVTVEARGDADQLVVSVADTGPGIPDAHLESVFAPFYTTKPPGEGAGLGLAIARGVVVEHQGTIRVERASEGGARFVVNLPALRRPEADGAAKAAGERPPPSAFPRAQVA